MAAVANMNVGNDADFFAQLLDSDNSDEEEFNGFNEDDIEEAIVRARVVRTIGINPPANDYNGEADMREKFVKIDGDYHWECRTSRGYRSIVTTEPMDFFDLLFEEDMWETLVVKTNLYAQQRLEIADLSK